MSQNYRYTEWEFSVELKIDTGYFNIWIDILTLKSADGKKTDSYKAISVTENLPFLCFTISSMFAVP